VLNELRTARAAEPFGRVIALHCSTAGGAQWRYLSTALGAGFELTAPEHFGGNGTGPWTDEHAFKLADEAERTIDLIDQERGWVHLVGHSYGGGVALLEWLACRVAINASRRSGVRPCIWSIYTQVSSSSA
jgi:pimeloyl-ACP methyl ester carboxylesterase